MIKVYFESKGHAELVATFCSEEIYDACYRSLVEEAHKMNMIVTESIEEENDD